MNATVMRRRRLLFGALVTGTGLALAGALASVLAPGGLNAIELTMLATFVMTLPWPVIGLWNAIIGFSLLRFSSDPSAAVTPIAGLREPSGPIRSRVALLVPIFHEDPAQVFSHLEATVASLETTGDVEAVDVWVLSDSQRAEVQADEDRRFRAWRARDHRPERLHLRRRPSNAGFKAGNLRAWLDDDSAPYDLAVVLDADSLMSGAAVRRMVHLMEANPRLGILQTLVVGLPATSAFARLFQFGMRQGMRTYTLGSAWWQGESGPYWGHNAILRVAPFREHAHLPTLPGTPPLGGSVLSHDQVEAALLRAAGWDVRVLVEEGGSYEVNPPTLPEFVRRDLRWCQGNMQYFRLLPRMRLKPLGRIQLALAILMYLGAPFWILFIALGFVQAAAGPVTGGVPWFDEADAQSGLRLFAVMLSVVFAPKLLGVLDLLTDGDARRRYGGASAILLGGLAEVLFGLFLGPVMALLQTVFIGGLFAGRTIAWEGRARDVQDVRLTEAALGLWLPTILGAAGIGGLALTVPSALPWAMPVLGAWLLAVPFAVVSAAPWLGRIATRIGLASIPEERDVPPVIARLGLPALRRTEEPAILAGSSSSLRASSPPPAV